MDKKKISHGGPYHSLWKLHVTYLKLINVATEGLREVRQLDKTNGGTRLLVYFNIHCRGCQEGREQRFVLEEDTLGKTDIH